MHQWDGEERRAANTPMIYDMIANLNEKIDRLTDENRATRTLIEDHMRGEDHLLAEFKNAFPDGDPNGHREYHKVVMEDLERRKRFRDAVIEKSLASLIWSMLVGLGLAVWAYLKDHIK